MHLIRTLRPGRRRQAGLSIVELMVGVAIGLVITAAAALLMSGQLVENRRLLTETQVQQDLRAAADIMAREMRRVGASGEVASLGSIWYPGSPQVLRNDMANTFIVSSTQIDYNYFPGSSALPGPFKYQQQGTLLRAQLSANSGWQELTDANVMRITSFTPTITTDSSAAVVLPCPKLCADLTTDCWPRFQVRKARITIEAEALRDSTVKRAISSTVRLRNDHVTFADWSANEICPL